MTKGKSKPPSRAKYERANPTVSCRVSKDIYARLQDIKDKEGKSFSDILKVGLGILEIKVEEESSVYQKGYEKGWGDAEETYMVMYCCEVCGGIIYVDTEEEKDAAGDYMQEHGWVHARCCKESER